MTDRTVVYRLRADAQQFSAQMKAAGASVSDAANKMTAANKEGAKFRQGLDTLGSSAGKVGLVAAAGLGAAVLKAANFDQAMSNVQAATHESAKAMESLRQAALDAGADTAFSATEAAAGIENLAKAGVSTTEILNGGLTGALDLAAAGGMEVADAAEAAAGAMAQFGLDGEQVPHVADLLAAAAGKAQGDVSDFTMALKQGGTVAAQTGLTLEETTGALAAMAEQSLLGSDAGTSFKTMLSSLTPNSEKAADAMAAYNISAFDAQGNFVGMTELAGQLRDGLGDLTDEQRAMALETIFGSDAVRAASIIYDNGAEGIADWTAKVNDAGFAAETAAIKQDNLRGDLEKLGGALETALIGTGDGAQGPLRNLTQGLTGVIDAYTELPPAAQNAAGGLLAAGAAVGGSIWVGSKLVQGIANTREAMEGLGLSGPKATKAMKGVAGAAAGLAVLTTAAAAIRSLQEATDESLPGMEALEGRLISLASTPDAFSFSLGAEFDSLADSIDRLTDPGKMDAFADTMQTPFEGLVGEAGSLRRAKAEIDSLDQALASLATSGNADVAADAVENLADQYGLSGSQVKRLMSSLPAYNEALASQKNDAKLAAAAQADLAGATGQTGKAVKLTAAQLKAQAEALQDARKAASETAQGFVNLGDGVDDAKVSLGQWIKQMANQADALNNFMTNAKQASKRGLRDGLINDLQDAGTAGALRMKQLSNATDEEIGKANRAWKRGQDAMRDYVNFKVPPKKIDVETGEALTAVQVMKNALKSIPDENVVVRVTRNMTAAVSPGFGPQNNAEGGFITGPGTGTSDSIPSYLSNGEYVIKAAAVDKYGTHMFDRLNAMHFASGGSVNKDKKKPKHHGGGFGGGFEAATLSDQAQAQAAEAAEMYYAELEYAQRQAERRAEEEARLAEEAAERQREMDEAIMAGQQRAWDQATDAAKAQVDAAQAMVNSVQANMDRIGQAATAAFGGSWFSGDQQRGMWAGGSGTGDWRSQAESDIAGLSERSGLISQLSSLGLTGAALEDLLGNQSNAGISAMIQAGDIDDFASLFAQRAALTTSVQQQAGQAGYGSDMASANAQLASMNAQFAALTAAIEAARPITVLEAISAQETARELARLMSIAGSS